MEITGGFCINIASYQTVCYFEVSIINFFRMRIYLIGFMGSGKSYTSKRLAHRLGYPYTDLDELIESRAGKSITNIFAEDGEASFRKIEAETLRATRIFPTAVIACGGGTPCYHDNISWMNEQGMTVFLDVPAEILEQRLKNEADHRPVLQGGKSICETIQQKLAERRSFYEQAHLHIETEDEQTDVAELISQYQLEITGH